MYLLVDPEGVLNTSSAIQDLAELLAAKVGNRSFPLLLCPRIQSKPQSPKHTPDPNPKAQTQP